MHKTSIDLAESLEKEFKNNGTPFCCQQQFKNVTPSCKPQSKMLLRSLKVASKDETVNARNNKKSCLKADPTPNNRKKATIL
jgi:hypothetical protein